jgi:hypothetical protein
MSNSQNGKNWQSEFLDQQDVAARDAMTKIAKQMGQTLKEVADPRPWTARYPWAAIGAATLAGLVGGKLVGGSGSRPTAAQPAPASQPMQASAKPSMFSSLLSMAVTPAIGMLADQVQKSLHQALSSVMAKPPEYTPRDAATDRSYAEYGNEAEMPETTSTSAV